jgi:hypothetical protein
MSRRALPAWIGPTVAITAAFLVLEALAGRPDSAPLAGVEREDAGSVAERALGHFSRPSVDSRFLVERVQPLGASEEELSGAIAPQSLGAKTPSRAHHVRAFFFSAGAWDYDAVLTSGTFNPRAVAPSETAAQQIRSFVDEARRLVLPLISGMLSASTNELVESAAIGTARRGPPPVVRTETVDGVEVLELSMSRPSSGDVQVAIGTSQTFVATWRELPRTGKARNDLAMTIMEKLIHMTHILETHKILDTEQTNAIVFEAVDVGSSFQ